MTTVMVAGLALQLLGLGWDTIEHRLDPTLAATEGVFGVARASHLLFAVGQILIGYNIGTRFKRSALRKLPRRSPVMRPIRLRKRPSGKFCPST